MKEVVPSSTLRCSSYQKGSLRVTLDYGHQLYLLTTTYRLYQIEWKTIVIRSRSNNHNPFKDKSLKT